VRAVEEAFHFGFPLDAEAIVVIELSGASAEPDTISTDAQGRASAEITLGSVVGEAAGAVRVEASASSIVVNRNAVSSARSLRSAPASPT